MPFFDLVALLSSYMHFISFVFVVYVSQGLAKKWSRDSLDLLVRVVSVKEFPDDKDLQ